MKKFLSLVLVAVIICSTFAGLQITSSAAVPSSGSCGNNVTYTFDSETGLLTISGSGEMKNYSSSSSPFCNQTGVKIIVINNGVTSIGNYAFYNCKGLTSVTIPDSVISIGENAFYGCSRLTSVTIPDGVTSIGNYAFYNCSGLTSVTIPESVTSINWYAFYGCSGLTSVTIPDSVKSIGFRAFEDCSSLTSITIPDSVTSIDRYAFYGCSGLTSVTIGNSVTSIGGYAFGNCKGLTSVTIPDSVTSIDMYAFYGCWRLTSVNIKSIEAWYKISFTDSDGYSTGPSNPLFYAHHLYLNGEEIKDLIISEGVTSIGSSAFYGCSGLISVTIPDGVTSIGDYAFYGCEGLTSVTIPNSVTSIGSKAFTGCEGVTSLTLDADKSYSNLEFPDSKISHIVLAPGTGVMYENYMGSFWYKNRKTVKEITLQEGITNISEFAFRDCIALTKVNVPASVNSIGRFAFFDCSNLKKIIISSLNCDIPDSPYTIDSSATIYGYNNSTAQAYAEKYQRKFISLDDYPYEEPIQEHNYSAVSTNVTCTHMGYTTYTCKDCGYTYTDDYIPMTEHTYVDTVTEPTTESQGYTVHTCKDCGYSYVDSITDILPSEMHYIIPSLADINATLTLKSDENEYTVTSSNGVFELNGVGEGVYDVYVTCKFGVLTKVAMALNVDGTELEPVEDVYIPIGDVNTDGLIDVSDISSILLDGIYATENKDYDIDGSGAVDINDVSTVLLATNYGAAAAVVG